MAHGALYHGVRGEFTEAGAENVTRIWLRQFDRNLLILLGKLPLRQIVIKLLKWREPQVPWFEVAMNHIRGMRRLQSVGQLGPDSKRFLLRQRSRHHLVVQTGPRNQLCHKKIYALLAVEVVRSQLVELSLGMPFGDKSSFGRKLEMLIHVVTSLANEYTQPCPLLGPVSWSCRVASCPSHS
jgi:hypothetical protein